MRHIVIAWAICVLCWPAHAQQIAWGPTLRKPYTAPKTFLAMEVSLGYAWQNARLPYLEDIYDIPCCTYDDGSSVPLTTSVTLESWLLPTIALSASIGMRTESAAFATIPVAVPRRAGVDLVTQYQLDAKMSWLSIGGGAKYRVPGSPISVGLGIAGNFLVSSEMSHKEIVVGPDDFYFLTDPPTKEMTLPVSSFSDIAGFVVRPEIRISYDIPLTDGYYLAPSFRCETTLGSISQRHPWSAFGVSLGVALHKGL